MSAPARRAAAAVLVTAVALVLGGCGGGGRHATDPPTAQAPAPAGDPATPGTGPAGPATDGPGSAADAPKVPDAQLTPPGGGSFTERQKAYLSGRVPRGTDPVAVLEGGQEICERLARTAKVDKDAAASALVTGDISMSGAAAAVSALCPDQQPVVDAAQLGFGDGTFTVAAKAVPDTSVAPGGYRAPHPSASCAWRVTGANGATLASGGAARLTVPAAAHGISSSGCYAWLATGRT